LANFVEWDMDIVGLPYNTGKLYDSSAKWLEVLNDRNCYSL